MKLKKSQRGFTLVEVVVVTCISSIVLSMVGSMIVFSMNTFANGVEDVQDSISISELQDFLKSELESATDILLQDTKPQGEWKSISLDGKVLTQRLEKEDDSSTVINSFEDFGSLKDDITSFKVMLVNASSKYANISISDADPYTISLKNANFSTSSASIDSTMKLYYKKDLRLATITDDSSTTPDTPETPEDTEEEPSVDEIIPPIPDDVDEDSTDYVILNGDFFGTADDYVVGYHSAPVYRGMILYCIDDGYWYQAKSDSWMNGGNPYPSSTWLFRKLNTTYSLSDYKSNFRNEYYKGEVIDFEIPGYEGRYECLQNVQWSGYPGESNWTSYWKKVDTSVPTKLISITAKLPEKTNGTAVAELKEDLQSSKYSFKGEYNNQNTYQVGDIVKITYPAKSGPDFIQYYRKVFDFDSEPGKTDNQRRFAWKVYSRKFSVTSAYEKGDLVWAFQNSSQFDTGFYVVQKDYYTHDVADRANVVDWIVYGNSSSYFKRQD